MIVVVTGGRGFLDQQSIADVLNPLHEAHGISLLYHGDASGADNLAAHWASCHNVQTIPTHANWQGEGRAAGPIRNRRMLEAAQTTAKSLGMPIRLVAFPGGRGTADCTRRAQALGIEVHPAVPETDNGK